MNDDNTGENRADLLGLKELVAMGVGGMIGGGIFSVLGLSISESGHAAPVAFLLGGLMALLTGWSYARLGLAFRSAGGSFTYVEHAFGSRRLAGVVGWMLLVGYVGTMGLYAYTFGAYGTALFGVGDGPGSLAHHFLETLVLLVFLLINLWGVRASGHTEDLIVAIKVVILALFAVIALFTVKPEYLRPFFDHGWLGVVMGAALIFVAYEGFELIPNAVNDAQDPERNLPRALVLSILITTLVYTVVSFVAVGNLTPQEVKQYGEYALAVAARPSLGELGFVLIGVAALFSTSSAINATLFGSARLSMVMAREQALPRVFGFHRRDRPIPVYALVGITAVTILFVNTSDLTIISSFASSTFLLIFTLINLSALRLWRHIGIHPLLPFLGVVMGLASWLVLMGWLWKQDPGSLWRILVGYGVVIAAEFLFSARGLWRRG